MRYFVKKSEDIAAKAVTETAKKIKLNPYLKGGLIGLGILGTGYTINSLTKKPNRVWAT